MSVLISGVLTDGTGLPMSGYHIILKARQNTSAVVMRTVATVVTGAAGEYAFEAQTGRYDVYLRSCIEREYCVGDISVYDDSKPGTLNDFLTALDEGDLKPDVVKRFEEMVAQAQQSAEAAAESERQAGKHVADAQQIKSDCETLADNVQQNAEAVAEDKKQVALLASSATQDAARAEQAVKDADTIVQKAVDKLGEAATLTGEAKASAEAAAKSEQNAKQHRDEAQRIVDDLKGTSASTTQKGLVQLCSDTDNDSEELAATPKAVKAVMDETKTKAPLDSPAFTGTPTTPTPPDDAVGLETANAAFVRKLLAALVDSSPEALDTLNELAAALGNDPNFATTVTKALAGKQPLNDVLTAVSQITPEENTLPYFSAEGRILLAQLSEKARALLALDTSEAMRTELELKAAATMEPQSDIRDRTPGRLALSGMYGFGQAFTSTEALAFNGQADFAEWLKEATPGRYAVSIVDSSSLLIGTTKFNGIIDVMWSPFDNDESDTTRKFKMLLCFNQYYEGEHSIHRLTYRWSENNWNATVSPVIYDGDSLAFLLSRTAGNGPSSYYKYPAVGSLILAVYQGTAAGDKAIKIGLGDIVPGSRLGPVTITCSINDAGSYVSTPRVSAGGAGAFSFPGRYQALSGFSNSYGDEGRICLFVRIE
ncbi:prophage tail fiber N-terminal domain-containing protein [Escherichia coli]|uniref:prophage tail fiber N-terminal domain-containing protein n=2 Tax=Escherichia coli TaxID=562 RepID=UPI000BE8D3B9|nr:prophage tail fiber N-terminal domain-containing protein [Escherichia coli]EJD5551006.1 prophage tail fiber N-terminal domain-containing protein [Escherichia coli]EJK7321557.1 prophage tail fiber N-terminal domain-containing protein [Escherichia coli]MBB7970149.1 prophage tail fiber N-terminal domain-containing protein [Escherichia coli]